MRLQPAEFLKATACTRLEAMVPFADAVFDGGIIANIKVEKAVVFEGTPVAAIKGRIVPNIECTCDYL